MLDSSLKLIQLLHRAVISIRDIQCVNSSKNGSSIFLNWFLKRACSACNFSQLWLLYVKSCAQQVESGTDVSEVSAYRKLRGQVSLAVDDTS